MDFDVPGNRCKTDAFARKLRLTPSRVINLVVEGIFNPEVAPIRCRGDRVRGAFLFNPAEAANHKRTPVMARGKCSLRKACKILDTDRETAEKLLKEAGLLPEEKTTIYSSAAARRRNEPPAPTYVLDKAKVRKCKRKGCDAIGISSSTR
jgi:hypothetical protein